jgi:8-oxo-dGTP pyrophosphatase MutT (NUDIX family)
VRTQTTTELLAEQDIIIFMNDTVQRAARGFLTFNDSQAKQWHVKDWRDVGGTAGTLRSKAAALFAQTTLRHITRSVDRLVRDITAVSWVDVCDVNDQPLGFRLPISWVNKNKTMWHRGVHVFVTTPTGYVIEKRAARIMFSPNLLDISVGGGVDSGETPLAAALREVHEELGVVATAQQLRIIELSKWATYHPRYKRYSRVHLSTYHLALATDAEFTLQQGEVAEVRVVKPQKVQVLLRTHSLRGFGRLAQAYKYYNRIVQKIEAGS